MIFCFTFTIVAYTTAAHVVFGVHSEGVHHHHYVFINYYILRFNPWVRKTTARIGQHPNTETLQRKSVSLCLFGCALDSCTWQNDNEQLLQQLCHFLFTAVYYIRYSAFAKSFSTEPIFYFSLFFFAPESESKGGCCSNTPHRTPSSTGIFIPYQQPVLIR